MSSRNSDAREIKVTVIETRFVQTDRVNFKAVVQQLTGRDQAIAAAAAAAAARVAPMRPQARRCPHMGYVGGVDGGAQGWCGELPPESMLREAAALEEHFLEELYALCASEIL